MLAVTVFLNTYYPTYNSVRYKYHNSFKYKLNLVGIVYIYIITSILVSFGVGLVSVRISLIKIYSLGETDLMGNDRQVQHKHTRILNVQVYL